MAKGSSHHYDILIAGAGFAGSLTALILNNEGFRVCLVERGTHPRFAIGESSTPIADMMLRKLAATYNLPWLHAFSRYGSWQKAHPDIVCGLKRGFSFFKHHPGRVFTTDENHQDELLVAASAEDLQSDTNWLRADFDAFLINKVKEAGIAYADLTEISSAKRTTYWEFETCKDNQTDTIYADFFLDATGGGTLLNQLLGVPSTSDGFLTNSFAVFSHFHNVARWTELLKSEGISTDAFPYDPDNSALHHLLHEGWTWVLQFNDGRTSVGFVLNSQEQNYAESSAIEIWNALLEKYPSVNKTLKNVSLVKQPGAIIKSGRLQRKATRCFGEGWTVLPHTAGFIDPLFSSGIAHSLTRIDKLVRILIQNRYDNEALHLHLQEYEQSLFAELEHIDLLIAGCYKTMPYFGLFNAWSSLYFAFTIAHESRLLKKEDPGCFLGADDPRIRQIAQEAYAELLKLLESQPSDEAIQQFTDMIREKIAPYNTAGLLDPKLKNMYRHTAAAL